MAKYNNLFRGKCHKTTAFKVKGKWRAVKTVAQTAVATVGTSGVIGEVNWIMVLSASALAGVLSVLTASRVCPRWSKDEKKRGAGTIQPP